MTGKMFKGILNFQREEPIKNLHNDDIMKSFVGIFPPNHMNEFMDFKSIISEKTSKCPFLIASTDSLDKDGIYW